jgi:hypothetical protein
LTASDYPNRAKTAIDKFFIFKKFISLIFFQKKIILKLCSLVSVCYAVEIRMEIERTRIELYVFFIFYKFISLFFFQKKNILKLCSIVFLCICTYSPLNCVVDRSVGAGLSKKKLRCNGIVPICIFYRIVTNAFGKLNAGIVTNKWTLCVCVYVC